MIQRVLLIAGMALGVALLGSAQAPPPSPAEQALQEKLTLDDGKPTQAKEPVAEPSLWRALGSLVVVLGLVGGGLYALRKYGGKRLPGSGGTRLKMEESLALGDRRFVGILRADDEHFLIALTPQGVTCLGRLQGSFEAALQAEEPLAKPVPVRDFERMVRGDAP